MQRKLTVSQLNAYISGVFEDEFVLHDVVVRGEIFEAKAVGARTFFTLKEGGCTLSCVTFAHMRADVGAEVDVTGTVTFYAKSGRVSFVAEDMTVAGEGALLAALKKLKEKLRLEGLFEGRPPLPALVHKAAVVTSEYGAVMHDILSVCRGAYPAVDICLCDARVQGADSAETIARAVNEINEYCRDVDVIIIARGGGSASDLQAYNTETVARAVAGSRIPVISAVGHETDYTLCDLCASARAGTPSIAASMITVPSADTAMRVLGAAKAVSQSAERLFADKKQRILYDAMRVITRCERIADGYAGKAAGLLSRLGAGLDAKAAALSERLTGACAALERLSPLKVLSQGYAKVTKGGREMPGVKGVEKGDEVTVLMRDGRFAAKVTEVEEGADVRKNG